IERLDQELNYGGRVVGTTLRHSDYAGMARALGLHGERVEKPEDLKPALQRAMQNAPALVDVVTSQTVISSDAQKGLGFVPDYQALTAWDEAEQKRRQQSDRAGYLLDVRFCPKRTYVGALHMSASGVKRTDFIAKRRFTLQVSPDIRFANFYANTSLWRSVVKSLIMLIPYLRIFPSHSTDIIRQSLR